MTAYLVANPPKVRQFRERGTTPSGVIVVHTAESTPDWVGPDAGAEAVARFIQGRSDYGSYHRLADSDSSILLVPYAMQAYGDGTGSNPHAIHLSAATQAAKWTQAPKAWREATVRQMAGDAADAARWLKREHGITVPARRITRAQSDARVPGFISHAERDPGRRSDPGPAFPWDTFLTYFAEFTNAQEDKMQLDDKLFPKRKDSRTVGQVLARMDRFIDAQAERMSALRRQVAALRAAVDANADRAEIKQMLENLDAEISIVVGTPKES